MNLEHSPEGSSKIIIDLINQPEFQRLKNISFLGFLGDVFDLRKDFSRYDHSIGVYNLGVSLSKILTLDEHSKTYLQIACLLHDIGHFPFSHLSEDVILKRYNIDHHIFTENIITGKIIGMDNIFKILKANEIDPEEIVNVINGISKNRLLNTLFSNSINLDTLDAISRCAFCLNIDYIPPQKLISLFHINSDNEIIILKKDLGYFDRFWKLKKNIYSNYIYSTKNLRKEAMFYQSLKIYFEKKKEKNCEYYIKLNDEEIKELILEMEKTLSSRIFTNLAELKYFPGPIIKFKTRSSVKSSFSNLYKCYEELPINSKIQFQKNQGNIKKFLKLYRNIREFRVNATLDLYLNNQYFELSSLNYRYTKVIIKLLILLKADLFYRNEVKSENFITENIVRKKLKKIYSMKGLKKTNSLLKY